MSRLPAPVTALLKEIETRLPAILTRNFVGVYLYGSLTQRAFDLRRSDVDAIVVTRRVLTGSEFRAVAAWLRRTASVNRWARRLQLSFLLEDRVLTRNAPACLCQFGRLRRSRSDGNPIIWMNVLASGRVLRGPPARTFVPPITRSMLVEALEREVGYLRHELARPKSTWRNVAAYRVYAVLTVCRILYSLRAGAVVSKPRAARWAVRRFPAKYHGLVRRALRAHTAGRRAPGLTLARLAELVEFAGEQVRAEAIILDAQPDRRLRPRAK